MLFSVVHSSSREDAECSDRVFQESQTRGSRRVETAGIDCRSDIEAAAEGEESAGVVLMHGPGGHATGEVD